MKEFFIFFHIQSLNYMLLCLNMRYIARGSYWGTGWTDGLIALIGFTVIQQISDHPHTWYARAGYVVGGVLGAQLGLWLTRRKDATNGTN